MDPTIQEAIRLAALAASNAATAATKAAQAAQLAAEESAIAAASAANAARALEIAQEAWKTQQIQHTQDEQFTLHELFVEQVLEESNEDKIARLELELQQARAEREAAEFLNRTVVKWDFEEDQKVLASMQGYDLGSECGCEEPLEVVCAPEVYHSPKPRRLSTQKFLETQRALEEAVVIPKKGEYAYGFAPRQDGKLERVVGPVEKIVTFEYFLCVKPCPPVFHEGLFKHCTEEVLLQKLDFMAQNMRASLDLQAPRRVPKIDEMWYGVLEGGDEPEKVKFGFGKICKVIENAHVAFVRRV
ncbi:hypothetical protein BJX70DRAFT_404047 [Aspergillus crustosus]